MMAQKVLQIPDGKKILQFLCKLLLGDNTPESLLSWDKPIPNEIVYEAELMVLIKKNSGLSQENQYDLLIENGFKPYHDKDRGIYVYFPSSYAPECDSYVYWNKVESTDYWFEEFDSNWKDEGF